MTVLNLQVSASADDGYIPNLGELNTNQPTINVGNTHVFTSRTAHGFMRFTGASEISGSDINSAELSVYLYGIAGSPLTKIRAELADNPAAPTTVSDLNGRTKTSSGVDWDPTSGSGWLTLPDISSVIQEVADNFSTSSVVIYHLDDGSATGASNLVAYDTYDSDPDFAPKLTIDYTPSNTAPTITVAPSVNYNGFTRTGPANSPISVTFEAEDAEETGANQLNYQIRTAAGTGGTLVASGTFTSGVGASVNIAHNASGLSEGSNTLYLRVDDGTDVASTNPSFTLLVDRGAPTVGTITHVPNPVVP